MPSRALAFRSDRPERDRIGAFATPRARLKLGLIIALSAVLSLYRIGSACFWSDESTTVAIAHSRGYDFLALAFHYEPFMALYYSLLHMWIGFGDSEFIVRLPSALFAIATIPIVFEIGNRLFDEKTGLAAALLLSVQVMFIAYAQEARSYSMAIFFAGASSFLLLRAVERGSLGRWIAYVAASTLLIYAHTIGGLLILAAHGLTLPVLESRWPMRVEFIISLLAVLVLSLPDALIVAMGYAGQASYLGRPDFGFLRYAASALLTGETVSKSIRFPIYATYGFCFLWAALDFFNAIRLRESRAACYIFLIACGAAPIVLLFVVSLIRPAFQTRYVLVSLPFIVLLAGAGVARIKSPWLFAGALLAMIAASFNPDVLYYTDLPKPKWRQALKYLAANSHRGDSIAFVPGFCVLSYRYYALQRDKRSPLPRIAFPVLDSRDRVAGEYIRNGLMIGPNPQLADDLRRPYGRLWVVQCQPAGDWVNSQVWNPLEKRCSYLGQAPVSSITIKLFANCGEP